MLENISSKYILKNLLFYISEKKKLNLVKYNKNLQIDLNIKLLNYKIFSGNYTTIYENNKKRKIYDAYTDKLIFEGEFLNGQKNGKGQEYDNNNNIIFDGEYINGERNGKGLEYYDNGKIKYEGEYNYGKKMEKEKNIIKMVN